jgi:lipopolysaccharide transport system permease protein
MSAIAGPASTRPFVRLWSFRELLRRVVLRNLKVKYQRSLLGFVWTLLNPLLMVVILTAVFSYVVRLPIEHYWAFLLSGYFAWNFFLFTLSGGVHILKDHGHMVRSIAFPLQILVLGATLARLVEFAVEMVLVLAALALFHHGGIPAAFLLLPALVVLQTLLALGIALPIASLSVFFNDFEHALPIALTMLFYVSPVFYPVSLVPESLQTLYLANPIAALLTLYHACLYEGTLPPLTLFLATAAGSLGVFIAGYVVFERQARIVPEIL